MSGKKIIANGLSTVQMKGSELPPRLARQAGVAPDQSVWVTISADNIDPRERMRQILRRSRAYAQNAILTEEKLVELLRDD